MRRSISMGAGIIALSFSIVGCTTQAGDPSPKSTGNPPGLAGSTTGNPPAGAPKALNAYIDAVQAGDIQGLLAMSNPRLDAEPAIKAKIDQIGNRQWTGTQIVWPEVIAANSPVADITASGPKGEPILDHVILSDVNGQWKISLGDVRSG